MMRKRSLLFVLLSLATMLLFSPAVVHAQWEPDVRLTYDASSSYTPWHNTWCVAATGDTIHVVWEDNRDGNYEIYTKRSTDGGTSWGQDTRLTHDSASSWLPSVAASGSNAHAVWFDRRDGNWEIYTKRSTDWGLTWGTDTRLTNDTSASYYPSTAASESNVHVVWYDTRDRNFEIYTKRSSDGGLSWGPDTRLTNNNAVSDLPSVAVSGSNVHVVWEDNRDGNYEIYTKRSSDGGTSWGPDTRLTNNPAYSDYPSVAVSGSNVHVVWDDTRDGNWEIYAMRSTDGGLSWGPDTRLTNDTAGSMYPSAAASGSNVHVVWRDNRDGNAEIYTKRSTDGGLSWSLDTRLTNDTAASWNPSVAVSGLKVHAVWQDNRDGNWEIYYKRNPTGNSGVETAEDRGQRLEVRITAKPNPFTAFATVLGHERDRFTLYDISGRRVGTYKGDRIGEGLRAGVYFVRAEKGEAKPLRVVKLR